MAATSAGAATEERVVHQRDHASIARGTGTTKGVKAAGIDGVQVAAADQGNTQRVGLGHPGGPQHLELVVEPGPVVLVGRLVWLVARRRGAGAAGIGIGAPLALSGQRRLVALVGVAGTSGGGNVNVVGQEQLLQFHLDVITGFDLLQAGVIAIDSGNEHQGRGVSDDDLELAKGEVSHRGVVLGHGSAQLFEG